MTHLITNPDDWPRRKTGEPIFTSTNQALDYAQLIHAHAEKIKEIRTLFQKTYVRLKAEYKQEDPNLDSLFALAVEHQFYRECLDQVERLTNRS